LRPGAGQVTEEETRGNLTRVVGERNPIGMSTTRSPQREVPSQGRWPLDHSVAFIIAEYNAAGSTV
jgi:hypothetical protein